NISVKYVGHTLADEIDLDIDINQARQKIQLEVKPGQSVIAVLPGSRMSEVTRLAKPFIETLLECLTRQPDLIFIIPFVNQKTRLFFEQELEQESDEQITRCPDLRSHFILFDGQSRDIMAASDAVLLASGTAALEALLLKKPMLVAYKLAPLTYWIAKRLLKVPCYSLPNLLAGDALVEEITQNEVCSEVLTPKLLSLLNNELWQSKLEIFHDIHILLRQNADQAAAQAVIDYLKDHGKLT
ncbi:MAG: lipid-A-disaccharide synthase, partial [Thiotrichaceae bacterium]|nr:lipid-A-disaccharide synthase [Thiotrichaceae bacterium]